MSFKDRLPHMLMLATSLAMLICHNAMGQSAQEKQKCVEQLTNMATCLPYVGGSAKAPTLDCCSGLIESIKTNKKCICFVVKDRDDPELGMKINLTLALGLPSLCKAPDNFSQCPCEFFQFQFFFLKLPSFLKWYKTSKNSNSATDKDIFIKKRLSEQIYIGWSVDNDSTQIL
jgi:hypothetical protein